MKTPHKLTLMTLGALSLGLVSTVAFTDPEGCGGWGPGHGPRGDKEGGPERGAQMMQAHRAEQMELLHYRLKLTSDQEGAWKSFTAAQQAQHEAMASHWKEEKSDKGNVVDHFNRRIQFMEEGLTGMKAVAKAANDLYASLTPDQKTVMDDFFANHHGFGHHAGHR